MKRVTYILIAPVLAGFLAGCGASENHSIAELPAVSVKASVAKSQQEQAVVSVSGKMEAGSSANISTRMMGNVSSVSVQPGDKVSKGDLLLTISSTDLSAKRAQVDASIAQAQSGFENAKKDLERFKVLFEKGSASEKELENMTTRFEMAEAGLEAAKQMKAEVDAQFAYTNLRAPFSGVVANTFVKVGDITNPGMPLVTVEGISKYEATVLVPESQISEVKVGAAAQVIIKSNNKVLEGTVKEVSPSAKNTGGQFLVKVDLGNAEGVLPGMFVNVDITTEGTAKSAPVVPASALVRNGQLTGLYTISDESTAVLRWVRLGKEEDERVEVLSGLAEGEKYIVSAEGKLFNGAKVSVQ
ncbi:MAG: efflux RND transporter periplasmic adaptor subunit [Ekhidna sp.]|uniref:efflux RND transporter periplasmic adaptor subunit n=1 Tax=Ekhidna sp. TaxID=2608089 RepID=UPI0032EB17BE